MSQDAGLFSQVVMHFLAPVRQFLTDEGVSEVMINGPDDIYIERRGILEKTDCRFDTPDALMAAVRNIGQFVGRRVDQNTAHFDARLPDGSRVHVVIPPCARTGPYIAIRRFSRQLLGLDDLVSRGSMTVQAAQFLKACVRAYKSLVVSGGTGSGKTTLLNMLSAFADQGERVITIEEACELQLRNPHVVALECRAPDKHGQGEVTIRDLLACSLRLRPDRIIVGEVRRGEALDMIQAMNTGHSGSMTTVHANSCRDALHRLETLTLMAGLEMPLIAARAQVASAVNLVVQAARFHDGARRITQVSEVLGLDSKGDYDTRDLFLFHLEGVNRETGATCGNLRPTGTMPSFWQELKIMQPDLDDAIFRPAGDQRA